MCWCVFMFRASPTDYFGSLFVLYCSLSPSFCSKRTYSITLSLLVSLHLSAEALGLSVLNLYIAVYCYGQNEWVPITPLTPDKKIKCYCVGNKQLKRRFALKDKKKQKKTYKGLHDADLIGLIQLITIGADHAPFYTLAWRVCARQRPPPPQTPLWTHLQHQPLVSHNCCYVSSKQTRIGFRLWCYNQLLRVSYLYICLNIGLSIFLCI